MNATPIRSSTGPPTRGPAGFPSKKATRHKAMHGRGDNFNDTLKEIKETNKE
jgi:hypothetical protein